jgi:hypothetical protein
MLRKVNTAHIASCMVDGKPWENSGGMVRFWAISKLHARQYGTPDNFLYLAARARCIGAED